MGGRGQSCLQYYRGFPIYGGVLNFKGRGAVRIFPLENEEVDEVVNEEVDEDEEVDVDEAGEDEVNQD